MLWAGAKAMCCWAAVHGYFTAVFIVQWILQSTSKPFEKVKIC